MYILDSDFIFARIFKDQSTHHDAVITSLEIQDYPQIILNNVLQEVITVISHKVSQAIAKNVYKELMSAHPDIYHLTREDQENAWKLFLAQNHRKVSFVDCANVAVARKLGAKVVSFDGFYRDEALEHTFLDLIEDIEDSNDI